MMSEMHCSETRTTTSKEQHLTLNFISHTVKCVTYRGIPLEPTCQELRIFRGLGAVFTGSVRISCDFPACRGGSAKCQTCLIFHRLSTTLDPDCGSTHLEPACPGHFLSCPIHFPSCCIVKPACHCHSVHLIIPICTISSRM